MISNRPRRKSFPNNNRTVCYNHQPDTGSRSLPHKSNPGLQSDYKRTLPFVGCGSILSRQRDTPGRSAVIVKSIFRLKTASLYRLDIALRERADHHVFRIRRIGFSIRMRTFAWCEGLNLASARIYGCCQFCYHVSKGSLLPWQPQPDTIILTPHSIVRAESQL